MGLSASWPQVGFLGLGLLLSSDQPAPTPTRWRVIAYMVGDNNLEHALAVNLPALRGPGVDIRAYTDWAAGYARREHEGVLVFRGPAMSSRGELNSAATTTLAEFLRESWEDDGVPTLFLAWGHGETERIFYDADAEGWMDMEAFWEIVAPYPFAVVAIDACSTLGETTARATALVDPETWIVGSPVPRRAGGFDYPALMLMLAAGATPERVARSLADADASPTYATQPASLLRLADTTDALRACATELPELELIPPIRKGHPGILLSQAIEALADRCPAQVGAVDVPGVDLQVDGRAFRARRAESGAAPRPAHSSGSGAVWPSQTTR